MKSWKATSRKSATANLRRELREAGGERILYVADAFREGLSLAEIHEMTRIDPWFLAQIEDLVRSEDSIRGCSLESLQKEQLWNLKRKGFSDSRIASSAGVSRIACKGAPPCAGTSARFTSGSIPAPLSSRPPPPTCTPPMKRNARRSLRDREKIMVLGGGPNRIGQGIEFDYCCVHARWRCGKMVMRPSW